MTCQRCLKEAIRLDLNITSLGGVGLACQHCERFWRHGAIRNAEELAIDILKHGRVYHRSTVNEGTVESGPWASQYTGVRWGRLHLIRNSRGETFLSYLDWHDTPFGPEFTDTYKVVRGADVRTRLANLHNSWHNLQARLAS